MEKDVAVPMEDEPIISTGKEEHARILRELCRICGNRCVTSEFKDTKKKILPHAEIYPLIMKRFSIDISTDQKYRHPPHLCYSCFCKILYEKQQSQDKIVRLASWPEHTSCCGICLKYEIQPERGESYGQEGHTPMKRQKTQHDDNGPSDQSQESRTEKTPTVSAPDPVESPTLSVSRSDATKSTDPLRRADVSLSNTGRTRSVGVVVSRSKQTQGDPKRTENDFFIITKSSKQDSTNTSKVKVTDKSSEGEFSTASSSVSGVQETSPVVTTSQQSNSNQLSAPSDEVIKLPTPASNKIMQAAALIGKSTTQLTKPISDNPQSTTPFPNKTSQLTTSTSNKLTTPTSNETPQSTTPTPNKEITLFPVQVPTCTYNIVPVGFFPLAPGITTNVINPIPLQVKVASNTMLSTTPLVTAQFATPTHKTTKLTTPTPSNTMLSTTSHGAAQLTTPTPSNTMLSTTSHGAAQLTASINKIIKLTTLTPSKTKQSTTQTHAKLNTPNPSKTNQSTSQTPKKTTKLTTPAQSKTIQLCTSSPNITAQLTALTGQLLKSSSNRWTQPLSKNKNLHQYARPNPRKDFQLTTTIPGETTQASRKVTVRWVIPPASNATTKSSNTPAAKKLIQLNPFATNKTTHRRTKNPFTPTPNDTNEEEEPELPDEVLNYILQRPLTTPLTKKMEKIATHLFQTKLQQSGGTCMTADFQTDDQNLTALLVPGKHKVNTRKAIGTTVDSQKKFIKHVEQIIKEFEEQSSPTLCRNCTRKDQLINKYRISLYEEKKKLRRDRLIAVKEAETAEATQGSSITSEPASSSQPATDTTTNDTSSRRARHTGSYDTTSRIARRKHSYVS